MPNIFVNLMLLSAYKVSATYFCHKIFHFSLKPIMGVDSALLLKLLCKNRRLTHTQVFPQGSSFRHRKAEVIQQQKEERATKCLQLPIWSVAHTAIRHYLETFKAFCRCCFIHLPNSLFKEHLTEVWWEAKWFQVCSSQEVENCIFEASKEKQYIHISHFQHSQILVNIMFSKVSLWHFFLLEESLPIHFQYISMFSVPPPKFKQVTRLERRELLAGFAVVD